jgi:hypothetical protein
MGKKQAFFIISLGGLLTYGASQLVDWSDEGARGPGGPESTELRKLRNQVRQLEDSVASAERLAREAQVNAQTAQAVASLRAEAPPAPVPLSKPTTLGKGEESPPTEGSGASPREPNAEEIVDQLDTRFLSEGVDPNWSREARRRAERFSDVLPEGARVISLECRSSMCRLEMSHPSLESFQGFVRKSMLGGEIEWSGAFMAAIRGDPGQPGGVQAVAYLAREGIDLSPASLAGP